MPWEMIGHEWAIEYLQRSIASGRTAHAYLITGPSGIGKALLALRMAQVFNCEQQRDAPCLQCRTCRRIASGNHPDVRIASLETQAAGVKASDAARQKDLKIDTIRAWQRDIALKPYEGHRRVFILHDAERLNEEASNAMLKTLEEPPPFALLILVANNTNLLSTIVSRCQIIRLRPLIRTHVAQALITHAGVEPERAALLAAWSNGRIGWALHAATSPDELLARQQQLDTLLALHSQPHSSSFRWAEDRSKEYRNGEQTTVFAWLDLWQSWWRDLLLTAAGCPESITHIDRRDELGRTAQHYKLQEIYCFVVRLDEAARQIRENVNPQLALENLLLHLPE